jgi:hypothetical protein
MQSLAMLMRRNGGISLFLILLLLFVSTIRKISIEILSFDNLSYTLVMLWLIIAETFVHSGFFQFLRTFIYISLGLTKLGIQFLVTTLQLLYAGF